MYEELGCLIAYIQKYYLTINENWESDVKREKINLKRTTIRHLREKPEIYKMIVSYREFLSEQTFDFDPELTQKDVIITSRTKAYNSMYFKVEKAMSGSLGGNIPVNKILNDLYGIRIILNDIVTYEDIKEYIQKFNDLNLKCINSSKNGYNGIHIYFSMNNFTFPWELQVWSKQYEKSNKELHKLYKQDYTKWEQGVEGGV